MGRKQKKPLPGDAEPSRRAVCIYCLEEKDSATEFNREHVLPQAFGGFNQSLVLTETVCKACNSFFSGKLELKFARDSIEGHARFAQGVTKPSAFKSIGSASTSRVEVTEEGPWKGVLCRLVAPAHGSALDLTLEPIPQIGFAESPAGPFSYFSIASIPALAELKERFGNGGRLSLRTWEVPFETVRALLEERGISGAIRTDEVSPVQGRVLVDSVFMLAQLDFRTIAKMAMNYLAKMLGASTARMAQFNEIRSYILHGRTGGTSPVSFYVANPRVLVPFHESVGWHTFALERRGNLMRAHVSLFGAIVYRVDLSTGPFHTVGDFHRHHRFDLADMHCREISAWPPRFCVQ